MILEKETYEKFGYYPSELSPQSRRRILAACDNCGKIREIRKDGYCALCRSCAAKKRSDRDCSIYLGLNNYEFLYKKYCEEGLNGTEIAEIIGCSTNSVYRALKRFGIKIHSRYQELQDYNFLYKKYWEERKTTLEIARIVGCSSTPVWQALRRLGIRTRTKSERVTGENNPMYGKHPSEETRQKISEALRGEGHPMYGKHFTEEHKRRIGEAHKNPSEETRRKLSEANRGKRNAMYGKHPSEETRQKMSEIGKRHWQDPEYVKKIMNGWNTKPNKVEKAIAHILEKYLPGEYAYNGDFSCGITIGGKIPDFVNINGKKTVIEVFGPWHDEQFTRQNFNDNLSWKRTEFGTKAFYSQFGFKCIVFWEEDLKRKDVEQFVLDRLKAENGIGKVEEFKQRKAFKI